MSKKSIYAFDDYKAFLAYQEQFHNKFQRGFRSRLAEEVGCQNAFISQVLNAQGHFSLEQGLKVARFLELDPDERQYFLWLIEFGRAGSAELRTFFSNLLDELKEKKRDIKNRLQTPNEVPADHRAIYYSQWYFSAIHMAVTIPRLRRPGEIASALDLPLVTVKSALHFLISSGLVQEKAGLLQPGPSKLHLDKNSLQILNHHANWRVASIASLARPKTNDLHYSTVSSLSAKDVEILRARFYDWIEDYVATVNGSAEETLYSFNLDFFSLIS